MLSQKDVDLLYPATGASGSVGEATGPSSARGDPAIASFTRSCLLNLAFADSKSKSTSGTSTFWFVCLAPPRPRPPLPGANPLPPALPGCLGARIGSLVLISLTFLVRLSMGVPFACPAGGNLAIAAATAAVAAWVASLKFAGVGWAAGGVATLPGCC